MPDQSPHAATSTSAEIGRRGLLSAGAGAAGIGVFGSLGVPTGTAGAFAKPSWDPVSMAMHIHSSFSEGIASMDAHLYQAQRLGVDVIWWTEHDFRKMAHGYRTEVGFDGPQEAAERFSFDWQPKRSGPIGSGSHSFVETPVNPDETGSKMLVVAAAQGNALWGTFAVQAQAKNSVYSTSYSDTTVELDVFAQQLGPDARVVIEITSSYRPPSGGRPAGQYRLQYRYGDPIGYRTEDRGRLGVIGLDAPRLNGWTRLQISPREDHARLWPDTVADDASLWRIDIGVMVRSGASARVVFDRLRFLRTRKGSAAAIRLQQTAIDSYASRYPGVSQYAAAEVSLVRHLNSFGGSGSLPSYTRPTATKNNTLAAQGAMIRWLRGEGATVCLNHPLGGSGGSAALAARLIRHNGMGAQVMEVGTRMRPGALTRVFDTLARNAVLLTANGSTDDHRGYDWLRGRRWLTRVWSPTRRQADLCAALEAGRAWFYDPLHWNGELHIMAGGKHMGGVLFTGKRKVNVAVKATELPRGASVDLVIGKCDFAGVRALQPINRVRRLPRRGFVAGVWRGQFDRRGGSYIRAVVRNAAGDLIGFSNPVWVLPPHRRDDVRVPALRR